jgi:hypothetical protein
MDKQLLQFLGNFYLNLAKSQEKWEEMSRGNPLMEEMGKWFSFGLSAANMDNLMKMMKNGSGMKSLDKESLPYMEMFEKISEMGGQAMKEYMNMMGMVPRDEHIKLVKKYELLKEKVLAQEETIEHLRMLLSEKGAGQQEVISEFNHMIKDQSEQFQELMQNVMNFYQNGEKKDSGQ